MLYQDALSLTDFKGTINHYDPLHIRKILFFCNSLPGCPPPPSAPRQTPLDREDLARSPTFLKTESKMDNAHKESTNAQKWNVCTVKIRMHASDGIRARRTNAQSITASDLARKKWRELHTSIKDLRIFYHPKKFSNSIFNIFYHPKKCYEIVLLVFSFIPEKDKDSTFSIYYHPRKVQR